MVSQADRQSIALLIEQIKKNPDNSNTVSDLASRVNMSVTRFKEKFKYVSGTTPHRFVRQITLERAKTDLIETTRSIAFISKKAGFKSVVSFERAFKRFTGMLPTAYRNKGILLLGIEWAFLHI
jgi:AraC family transcriptional regulator, transcriptional activator FtrA